METELKGFLARRVANVADREDLAQEILLKAWAGWGYRGPDCVVLADCAECGD